MTDIEERLLAHSGSEHGGWIMKDAAAEIARLRTEVELLTASRREIMKIDEERVAEIERLRAEREKLRELFHDHYWDSLVQWRGLILKHIDVVLDRAALEPKP